MALPENINDLEKRKFEEVGGEVAVRTTATLSGGTVMATPSGLTTAGRILEVTLSDASWTALPATPLTDRNAIAIQNQTAFEMKVNYSSGVGYIGMIIPAGGERFYDIRDTVVIYGRFQSGGSGDIIVEEIS